MRVIFVHHGEVAPGTSGDNLSFRGMEMAASLIDRLPEYVDLVGSSVESRCINTIDPYANRIGASVRFIEDFGRQESLGAPQNTALRLLQISDEARQSSRLITAVLCVGQEAFAALEELFSSKVDESFEAGDTIAIDIRPDGERFEVSNIWHDSYAEYSRQLREHRDSGFDFDL